jgi:hypothetical protein
VSRRIEIELTSARPDGSWTWRAAGAREPRGVLDGSLLHSGAKAGDVLRAEADFELEGITIVSVLAPKTDSRVEAQRIEVVGPRRPDTPGVTTQLVGRSDRRPGERRRDRDDGRPRRERDQGRPQTGRDTGRPHRDGAAEATEQPARTGGRRGPGDRRDRDRDDRPAGPDGRAGRERAAGPGRRDRVPTAPAQGEAEPERRRPRRLNPGTKHRRAVMESLAPEEQPIAEQVLRGGIPAVRTALHLEREKALAEGRPAPNTDELVAMAERLLPRLKAAEWRDRAEAAAAGADEISLRDLRSVVAGADVARDEETRALATRVREALDRRVTAMHDEWSGDISRQLDEGRVVRALRLSARPPDPGARLDAELTARLTDAASAAMSPEAPPERWSALLDAVALSPVRRSVQPVGLPPDPPPDLKRSAHQHSGSIPALAKLLGVSMPPPPVPSASRRRPDGVPAGPRRAKQPRRRGGSAPAGHEQGSVPAPSRDPVAQAEEGNGSGPASEAATVAGAQSTPPPADSEPSVAMSATTGGEAEATPQPTGANPVGPEGAGLEASTASGSEPIAELAAAEPEPTATEAPTTEAPTVEATTAEASATEAATTEPSAAPEPIEKPLS